MKRELFLKKMYYIFEVCIICNLIACSNNDIVNVFQNGELRNLHFESEIKVEFLETDISCFGAQEFILIDSLFIFNLNSEDYNYKVYNMKSKEYFPIIKKGRGPNEIRYPYKIYLDSVIGDTINLFAVDNSDEKYINISVDINSKKTIVDKENIKIEASYIDKMYQYEKNEYFIEYCANNESVCYGIVKDDTIINSHNIFNVNDYESFLFTNYTALNYNKGRYVSAMKFLDQINIYNIHDPEISFTMFNDIKWVDIDIIQNKFMPFRKEFYQSITSSDEYIFALYANQTRKEWATTERPVEIHIISWDGEPLIKIHSEIKLCSIFYDKKENIMYALNLEDQILKLDMSEILDVKS